MGQTANAKRQKFINLKGFPKPLMRHKFVTIMLVLAFVAIVVFAWTSLASYSQKFSREDFEKLATRASTVLNRVSATKTYDQKTCRYERPTEFGMLVLFCSIQAVTYMPYRDPAHALAVARNFDFQIQRVFGTKGYAGFSTFYLQPSDSSDTATVTLVNRSPSDQCNFYIASNVKAQRAAPFAIEKTGINSIALSFECSTESRGEYYPVTNRQA